MRLLILAATVFLAGCSDPHLCTLIGVTSGVAVDVDALPQGATGRACVVDGPCADLPVEPYTYLLLAAEPSDVTVRVEVLGRPVEELSGRLQPRYPNGEECGAAGYQLTLRLTAGASELS